MSITLTLGINRIPGLRIKEKILLSECFDSPDSFSQCRIYDMYSVIGRRIELPAWHPEEYLEAGLKEKALLTRIGVSVIPFFSHEYPPLLREIYDPPFLLYRRGASYSSQKPVLAIVGTRKPTGKALSEAFRAGFESALQGVPVVSGLALGIDGAAHRGALDGRGQTLAVLGNGIDGIYPKSNRQLAARILKEGGTLFSEYGPGVEPRRYHFPARNRIISGIARGVLVVQAPVRSGALITADYALEQGRDLYIHTAGIGTIHGKGGEDFIRQGCGSINGVNEIFREWWGEEGFPRPSETKGNNKEKLKVRKDPAKEMAAMVEDEIHGRSVRFNGLRLFRRAV